MYDTQNPNQTFIYNKNIEQPKVKLHNFHPIKDASLAIVLAPYTSGFQAPKQPSHTQECATVTLTHQQYCYVGILVGPLRRRQEPPAAVALGRPPVLVASSSSRLTASICTVLPPIRFRNTTVNNLWSGVSAARVKSLFLSRKPAEDPRRSSASVAQSSAVAAKTFLLNVVFFLCVL